MQGSKTPTLSIGPKKAKVFGRPPDGSSVASESMSESHNSSKINKQANNKSRTTQNPTLTLSMSSDRKKRQTKIPSYVSENSEKLNYFDEKNDNISDFNQSNTSPSFSEKQQQRSEKAPSIASRNSRISSLSKSSTKKQTLSLTTNPQRKKSNASNISNQSTSKRFSLSAQQQEQVKSPSQIKQKSPSASPTPSPSPQKRSLDDDDDYNSCNSPAIYDSPKRQSDEQLVNNSNATILPIVDKLIDENAPLEKIGRSINTLEDWQQDIINLVHPIEEQHQIMWFNSMFSLFSKQSLGQAKESKKILYYDELVQKSREILENHRFSYPAGTLHRFKMVITGPNQSGKSTFLSIFAKQYLLELIASDQWKHTFIFPIDFSLALPYFTDLASLYCYIVQLTFSALAIQRPLLIQYSESLTHAFQTVISGSPILPKPFLLDEDFRLIIPAVQQLLDINLQCWQDSTAMSSFIYNIFMFPYFISNIFGFTHFTVIADNLDQADITKNPSSPFSDSTESVFMVEVIKLMLNQSSYIISGKNSFHLVDIISTVDSESKGYAQVIETLSTLKLIKDDEDDSSYNITFEGDKEPSIHLSARYMGGCPLYLYKWKEINEKYAHIKELENSQKNEEEETGDEDVVEEKLSLVNLCQSLLKQIMVSSDGSPYNLSIKNVAEGCKSSKK